MLKRARSLYAHASWLSALALIAAACADQPTTAGASGSTIEISSPQDGSSVSVPFTLELDSSVPLGDPSTGNNHAHLCFDASPCTSDYELVYGNSIEVTGLGPGQHKLVVSLRNADHSDAGASDEISVTVTGGAEGAASESPSDRDGYGGYGG